MKCLKSGCDNEGFGFYGGFCSNHHPSRSTLVEIFKDFPFDEVIIIKEDLKEVEEESEDETYYDD